MNKKLKIVSSIALAGMLVTSSFGLNRALAAEETADAYETNPVAIYRKLVEGKTVVPFVLANKDDVVTVKEVVESDLFAGKVVTFNGTAIPALETVVKTGDRFTTTDGTEYTVVVYGDVDGDGKITGLDALQVQSSVVNVDEVVLNNVQREAADVLNDGNVNGMDALKIREYVVGKGEYGNSVISELPPKEEVVEQSNYTMTLKDASYINNQNYDDIKLNISLAETLDEDKEGLKLEVSDKDGKKVEIDDLRIPAHTDFIEDILANNKKEPLDLSKSNFANGNITINLYEGEKIIATLSVEKNTVVPAVAKVTTNRTSTREATLSLEKMGESDVTKVNYVVKAIVDGSETATEEELTNSVNVENGKLENAVIARSLETDIAYKIFYTVENKYGSKSEMKEAVITKDSTSVSTEKTIEKVETPDLTAGETEFTWEQKEANKTYVVTLYRDGAAVAEAETKDLSKSFAEEMKTPGTYKVAVVVKGAVDGTSRNSSAVESGEVTVTKLNAVENLRFENREDGKVFLVWDNSNSKDDFASYKIDIYKFNDEGKLNGQREEGLSKDNLSNVNEKNELINEVEVNLTTNTIYVAKVTLNAKANQSAIVNSDEATSEEFFIVKAPNTDPNNNNTVKGTTSVTFKIVPINIANKKVSYKVEVYDVKTDNDQTEARYTLNSTRDVTLNTDNEITIDGLTSLNTYAFKLIATVDGNEVKSEYSDEIRTLPVISNLTVTTDVNEAGKPNSGKIAVNGTSLVINGETFKTADATEGEQLYSELTNVVSIVKALEAGDVLSVDDKITTISVKIDGNASVADTERDFTSCGDLKGTTVELESNKFTKTIKGNFSKLVLKGEGAIYDLSSGVNGVEGKAPIIEVNNGVVVVGDKAYNVQANSEVEINAINVKTKQPVTINATGTTLNATGTTLNVAASDVENDLEFVNNAGKAVTITFEGNEQNTAQQKGTITIKTNGGSVTVTAPESNVSAEMKVEVTNGEVDIKDPALTGNKTVTVSVTENQSSVVVAKAQTVAPIAIDGKELKDYTDEEIKEEFGEGLSQDKIVAIDQYINSFGLNGTGATIQVSEGSDEVTITLPEKAQNVTIGNLK